MTRRYTALHSAVVVGVIAATTPKSRTLTTFRSISGFALHPCITTTHPSYSFLSLKFPQPPCAVLLVKIEFTWSVTEYDTQKRREKSGDLLWYFPLLAAHPAEERPWFVAMLSVHEISAKPGSCWNAWKRRRSWPQNQMWELQTPFYVAVWSWAQWMMLKPCWNGWQLFGLPKKIGTRPMVENLMLRPTSWLCRYFAKRCGLLRFAQNCAFSIFFWHWGIDTKYHQVTSRFDNRWSG